MNHVAGRVRDLASTRNRHAAADLIRHAAGADFRHPASAADRLSNDFRAPDFAAADRRRALHFNHLAAAWLCIAATVFATAGAARIRNTLFDDRAGNAFLNRLPFATANFHPLGFRAGLAHGVADVFVTRLRFRLIGRVALIAITGLSHRSADGVADVAVASLVARFADGVALVAPARLRAGDADGVALIAIAGLVARDADRGALIAPARLRAGPADGVAFVAIAGVMHGLGAADRNLLADLVIDRLAADFFATIPHDLLDRFVTGRAALTGLAHVAARRAR